MAAKGTRTRAVLFLVALLWAVGASGASAWLFMAHRGPIPGGGLYARLRWRARRAGYEWIQGSPDLPERSSSARHWLLSIVENPEELRGDREEALGVLVQVHDPAAWLSVADELLNWADGGWDPRLDGAVPASARWSVASTALQTSLPDEQVLHILMRAHGQGWQEYVAMRAEQDASEAVRKRARHLLDMAAPAGQKRNRQASEPPSTPP